MARATFVKSAQKNIYQSGKHVKYTSKKGKREGQELTKLDRTVPKDENDPIFIAKGESYYWWAFKNGGKHFSKTAPKQSQLTQSAYLGELYSIQEELEVIRENISDADDLSSSVDDIKSRLEELKETTEGSLENMPEGLQQGDTGQLLQERIDALDNAISEMEGIDFDYDEQDEDDLREEAIEELGLTPHDKDDEEEGEDAEEINEAGFTEDEEKQIESKIEEKKDEHLQEWLDEKCDELTNISFE